MKPLFSDEFWEVVIEWKKPKEYLRLLSEGSEMTKQGGSKLEVQHHKFVTKQPSTQHEFQRNYARGGALAVQSIFARVRNLG